jgi:hypothetical protein
MTTTSPATIEPTENPDEPRAGQLPRVLTATEAAAATGLTVRAIRRRLDRGTLQHVKRDGVRLIPRSELERHGLLGGPATVEPDQRGRGSSDVAIVVRELRLELRAVVERATTAEGRAMVAESAVEGAQLEVFQTRAELLAAQERMADLERQLEQGAAHGMQALPARGGPRRRWFGTRRTRGMD